MPISDLHRKKLKKNIAIGALVFLWCALIWMVTMIRIANAQDYTPEFNNNVYHVGSYTYRGRNYSGINIDRKPVDARGGMYNTRFRQQQKSAAVKLQWDETFYDNADLHQQELEARETARHNQLTKVTTVKDGWDKTWLDETDARLQAEHERDTRRAERVDIAAARQREWWDAWGTHEQEKELKDQQAVRTE